MKLTYSFAIALSVLTIAACSTLKKNKSTASAGASEGVYAPGAKELTAIQAKYKDVTMQTLAEGHALYTGVCTGCHNPKSIYSRKVDAWPGILDEMAKQAKITVAQKDAIYKYVLAIKAVQPK